MPFIYLCTDILLRSLTFSMQKFYNFLRKKKVKREQGEVGQILQNLSFTKWNQLNFLQNSFN